MMNPFLAWQLVDSAFPTGGFAHSGGLEAAVQLGLVKSAADLALHAAEVVRNGGAFALPFVAAAHASPHELAALDARLDAYTPSEVANRASREQGEALLRAARAAFGDGVEALARSARAEGIRCHLAPLHGAIFATVGAPLDVTIRAALFVQLRGVVSAAVRLGLVGPLEAQALQADLATSAEDVAAAAELRVEDAAQVTPILDVLQGHQDRLYSRLFRS